MCSRSPRLLLAAALVFAAAGAASAPTAAPATAVPDAAGTATVEDPKRAETGRLLVRTAGDGPAARTLGRVDSDGDGFVDAVEMRASELPGADPYHRDVYVEVDVMAGCSTDPVNRTVEAFASAPVGNPDGERGIALHAVVDDRLPRRAGVTERDLDRYRNEYYDRRLEGYHYVALVEDMYGQTGLNNVYDSVAECRGTVFMHELGHSLGLVRGIAGIDSRAVSFPDYPSVMNYNAPSDHFDYSTGGASEEDFDDWGFVAGNLADNSPNTRRLRVQYLEDPAAVVGGGTDGGGVWNVTATPATNYTGAD